MKHRTIFCIYIYLYILSGDPFKSEGFTSDPFASEDPFKDAFGSSSTTSSNKVSTVQGKIFQFIDCFGFDSFLRQYLSVCITSASRDREIE